MAGSPVEAERRRVDAARCRGPGPSSILLASPTGRPVALHPGTNAAVLPHAPLPSGFHTFRVQIEPAIDRIAARTDGPRWMSAGSS